jgi:hypothetical protein
MSRKKGLSAKHFDSLFKEAEDHLKEVRIGDPASHDRTLKSISTAKDISLDTLNSLQGNPHFNTLHDFLQAQEVNATNVLLERDANAQHNQVLSSSIKIMLRETMFAKTSTQRDAYLSRIHDWYSEHMNKGGRPESGGGNSGGMGGGQPESNETERLVGSPERQRERQARAERYSTKGPNWKQPRPKSATTNVFLAGTTAGTEHDAAINQFKHTAPSSLSRPASAAAARRAAHRGAGTRRPATASNDRGGSGVLITGRLNQGGYMVRNLFRSQRNRVNGNVLSRAQKRKQLSDIQKAEQLHRADVNESLRSHQHLLKEKTTIVRSSTHYNRSSTNERPKSAATAVGISSGRGGTTSSNTYKRPVSASNAYKYPKSSSSTTTNADIDTQDSSPQSNSNTSDVSKTARMSKANPVLSLRQARERDQWLEETWLRGRSLDAADERNQAEITAAMQQWAMNRGRIEEEIMRRQESRRYVARSGRYYASTGSYDGIRTSASEKGAIVQRPSVASDAMAEAAEAGKNQRRPRTAKSAPRAKPIVKTPVVVLKKNRVVGGTNTLNNSKFKPKGTPKKPPMHYKYGPRTVNNGIGGSAASSIANADSSADSGSDFDGGKKERGVEHSKRPRPASAAASTTARSSLSPYRGNYGTSVVTDSFGVRGENLSGYDGIDVDRDVRTSKNAWNQEGEVNDGEIAVLAATGSMARIPPPPLPGSVEETEIKEYQRVSQIAFGAAIRREASLRPPPVKTTSKGGKKKKKGKKGGGKKKKGGKKGKKDGDGPVASTEATVAFIPRPSEQRPNMYRRPMSSQGRRTLREVETIKQAFTKHSMELPCSEETLENALRVPEELSYDECIANLPAPGGRFLADPLAKERAALKALYSKGTKGGGGGKKKKVKKKGGEKKGKKKK